MKYIFGILAFYSAIAILPVQAKTAGVGVVLGAPTGLSANLFMSESKSIHTTLAWDLDDDDEDELQIASHYTWWRNDFALKEIGWFYGFGGRFQSLDDNHRENTDRDDFELGPSATAGLNYEFSGMPLEAFVKGNLTFNIIQDTETDVDAMLGIHYNF